MFPGSPICLPEEIIDLFLQGRQYPVSGLQMCFRNEHTDCPGIMIGAENGIKLPQGDGTQNAGNPGVRQGVQNGIYLRFGVGLVNAGPLIQAESIIETFGPILQLQKGFQTLCDRITSGLGIGKLVFPSGKVMQRPKRGFFLDHQDLIFTIAKEQRVPAGQFRCTKFGQGLRDAQRLPAFAIGTEPGLIGCFLQKLPPVKIHTLNCTQISQIGQIFTDFLHSLLHCFTVVCLTM